MRYWLALLVAFAGVAWYFSALAAGRDSRSARWLIGAGVLWYVVARIVSAAMRWRG